ncbi:MAG: DUF1829 domain-containing protein [Candidatus Brocadia sp.]|nr:DUF1829 domain-containing protein [Candidatus Brocadia sp.]
MSVLDCDQLVETYAHWLKEKVKKEPERILRAINHPTKNNVSAMIFSWDDARKIRSENSIAIAVLNDQDKEITPDAIHALKTYEIEPIVWSKREGYIEKLVA